jgi:hydrogenase nickel incorporation protein HypA/HybF
MHEYSIVQALVERVEAEARARQAISVHRLSVSVGELSGVEVELLLTAYATFRDRTICEHAELDVRRLSARWECPRCRRAIERGAMLQCAACATPATLVAGGDIMLDQIEMEVP